MGREIKRVPLNFDWPLNETWKGYINPHYAGHCKNCEACKGTGTTSARKRLEELVSLILLSGSDSIDPRGKPHPYFCLMGGLHHTDGIVPSPDMAELTAGLAGRGCAGFMGHDAIDQWTATRKIIEAAGMKKGWGKCKACNGEGSIWDSPENRTKANRWRRKEPPKGKAYQVWQTVSEGSPITPPFLSPEELADWWLAHPWNSCDPKDRDSIIRWIRGPGWAPSMVTHNGVLMDGVTALSRP